MLKVPLQTARIKQKMKIVTFELEVDTCLNVKFNQMIKFDFGNHLNKPQYNL